MNKSKFNKKQLILKDKKNHFKSFMPKRMPKPFFKVGDVVGFKGFNTGEGVIESVIYENDEIKYIIKKSSLYSNAYFNEYCEWELYMMPLTRIVCVEKTFKVRVKDFNDLWTYGIGIGTSTTQRISFWQTPIYQTVSGTSTTHVIEMKI